MTHLDSSTLATYNSLVDPHLQCYFSNERIRSHLKHAGLISRRGEIVSDNEYRLKISQREHKKHVRQMLAENIVHRAIDMERARQAELRRKYDMVTKAAIVNSIKESRRRGGHSSPQVSNSNDAALLSMHSSWSQIRPKSANLHEENGTDEEFVEQPRVSRVHSAHVNPDHRAKHSSKSPVRRRQLNRPKSFSATRPRSPTKPSESSLSIPPCQITMVYYGPHTKVDYDHSLFEPVDEIIVMQQHCGGENLIVYKDNLKAGDEFKFNSRRHIDYPFGLSLYVKGLIDSRISTCCEYKHRHGVRLGGERGHFAIVSVEGSKPCIKCRFAKQTRFKQYENSNETDDENKKPITISLPVSDKTKSKQAPVKIPVRRTPDSNENYSEDFDGSSSAEKQKSGHSSDSTREKIKSPESSPKIVTRARSPSETSSTSTITPGGKSSTKTWQIVFHTSNVPNGSFKFPKQPSSTALLKISYLTANGKYETEEFEIDMKDFSQCFKSGRQDSFGAKLKNIGQPKQIRLKIEITGDDNEDIKWHLDHIELIDPEPLAHYKFPCNCWIYPSEEKLISLSESPKPVPTRKPSTSSKSSSSSSTRKKRFQKSPKGSSRSSSSSYEVQKPFQVVPKTIRRISTDVESEDQTNKVPYRIIIYPSNDDHGEFNALSNSRIFVRLNNQTKNSFLRKKDSKYCPSFEPGEEQTFEIKLGGDSKEKPMKLTIGYQNSDIAAGKWKLQKIVLINIETGEETIFPCNEPLIRDDLTSRAEKTFQSENDDQQNTPRNVDVVKHPPSKSESKENIPQKPIPSTRKQSSSSESVQQKPVPKNRKQSSSPESIQQKPIPKDRKQSSSPESIQQKPIPKDRKQSSSPESLKQLTNKKTTDEKSPPVHSTDEDNEYNRMFKKNNSIEKPELDNASSRPKTRRGIQDTFDSSNDNEQGNTSINVPVNNDIWRPSSGLDNKEPVDPLIGLDDLQDQTARSNDPKTQNTIPSSPTNQSEDQFKDWYPKNDDDDD